MAVRPSLSEVKADLFKGLAHPVRIRVLELLHDAEPGELSVGELLAQTGLEASHLSQHLAVLRRYRLVESDRRGSQVYYRLAYASVGGLLDVSRALLDEVLEATHSDATAHLEEHQEAAR